MYIHTVQEILNDLNMCIVGRKPFSIIRFGDGGLKFIHAILTKDKDNLKLIIEKEGLPEKNVKNVLKLWVKYANQANYIDSPQVYFDDGVFWPRIKNTTRKPISIKTYRLLAAWKRIYDSIGITNEKYCNPEFNYLCMAKREHYINLYDVLKDRKVAFITACPKAVDFLNTKKLDVDLFKIVKQYDNHYENSFHKIIKTIKEKACDYDVWLVSSGELGRIYSGVIKEMGGRTVDMGFMAEVWAGRNLHPRLKRFINVDPKDRLYLKFQLEGHRYLKYI